MKEFIFDFFFARHFHPRKRNFPKFDARKGNSSTSLVPYKPLRDGERYLIRKTGSDVFAYQAICEKALVRHNSSNTANDNALGILHSLFAKYYTR